MTNKDYIHISEQFEMPSDPGYLASHIELTKELSALVGRPDKVEKPGHTQVKEEKNKDEMFEQACENIARRILLSDQDIPKVSVQIARQMVLNEYQSFLDNPDRAASSRASAVH